MKNKKKILYITTIPSPYRVAFFNELGKRCNLTVLFEKSSSDERDKSWDEYQFDFFSGILMRGKKVSVNTAFCPEVIRFLKKGDYDFIICGNIATPTGILEILYMKTTKRKYYIEADGAMAKSGKGIKEKIKHFVISGANGYFSSSVECDKYFITYGAKKEKIYRYPFTSLYEDDLLDSVVAKCDKKQLREKLGIIEDQLIISVGRFSYMGGYGKGFDTLMTVAEHLDPSIGVYIIGDEPTEEFKKMKIVGGKKLANLHFVSFLRKPELALYYKAADMFVLLSRGEAWGLVINEAMAHGLPIITTDQCVAGVELIVNDKNGYIVNVDDADNVVKHINDLLRNESKRNRFAYNSLNTIQNYTIEKMVNAHLKYLLGD